MGRRQLGKIARSRQRVARIEEQAGLDRVQEVLCEPARLRIVGALEEGGELTVGELAEVSERKVPATSQHLRVLRSMNLVEGERRGTAVYYRLRSGAAVEQVQAVLAALSRPAAS